MSSTKIQKITFALTKKLLFLLERIHKNIKEY